MEKTIRRLSALALSLAVLLGLLPMDTLAAGSRDPARKADAFLTETAPVFQSGRSYGGRQTDVFQNVISTSDGGFLVSGYSMGASEDPAWTHVGSASNNDALLFKFDASGNLEWHKAYQTEGVEVFTSIAELSDGRLAAVGRQAFTAGETGSELMKGVCWYLLLINPDDPDDYTDYHIGGAKGDNGYGVSATPDGGFVVAGWSASDAGYYSYSTDHSTYSEPVQLWEAQDGTDESLPNRVSSSGSDSVAVKFDRSGNVVFTALHNYCVTEDFYTVSTPSERTAAMAVDSEGNIFLAGTSAVAKNVTNGFVAKLSGADGSLLWHRTVGSSSKEEPSDAAGNIKIEFRAMDVLADDSVVISGTSTNDATTDEHWTVVSEDDILVLRYDGQTGRPLFVESIGTVDCTGRPEGVAATGDGGWMVCGSMNRSIVESALTGKGYVWGNYGGQDGLLIRYNSDNSVAWAGNYGSRNGDWFNDAAVLNDGAIVVVGESNGQYGTPAWSNHGGIDGILLSTGSYDSIYTEPVNAAADGNVEWADGTYTATGDGFGGENSVEVTVVIADGSISSVTGESRGDTAAFYGLASALHNTIAQRQSAAVDGVSGATYSSNGIKEAASRALGQAAAAWVDGLIDAIAGKSSDNAKKTATQTAANAYTELGTYSAGLVQNLAVLEAACETYGIDLIARTDFVTPDVTEEPGDSTLRHNDTYYAQQYAYYQNIHTEAFEDAGLTGEGVVIAVIDSGLTASHTDLDYSRVLDGYDYDAGAEMPRDALIDNNGHGTAVTGILAAISDNGIGVAGLLSQVRILPVKVTPIVPDSEGAEESSAQVAQAIRYAADRADVITTSLSVMDTEALRQAVAYAAEKNVLLIGAAGNSSTSEADPYLYPASYDQVVSVGAVDANNVVRPSSQKNDKVFVTAPGEGIVVLDLSLAGRCKVANGTSYAAPLVAAMAAAAKQQDKDMTVERFQELLQSSSQDAGAEGYDTPYGWGIVDFAAFASALQGGTDGSEPSYVLMNIPYRDFYAAEVNGTAPNAATAANIDAWTSATKSKPLSGSLSAGSYHVNSDGSDISGVIYPVQVSDLTVLNGQTRVTDETTVSITTTTRGETTTTEYNGADALFQSASYSYYALSEAPTVYKVLTANNGVFSFGPSNAPAQTVSGVTGTLNYETHHHNDVEIALNGVELPEGAVVSGVIVTDSSGNQYPLRHMEGIWRQTQIGWPDTAAVGIGGKTLTNVRFILRDRMLDCPVNFLVKPKLNAEITAAFTGAREITLSGLTDAVQNPTATVTYTTGQRPNVETHTVAENAAITGGKVTLTEDAIDGTAYTVRVVSGNYGDKSASVTYTAPETPQPGTEPGTNPTPGTDTPDPAPGTDTPEPGNSSSGQGCYVATSVYGSYDCPEVWTLRRYRDEVLGETWYGRLFIKLYYAVSPTAVRLFGGTDLFQNFFRARLDRMVDQLQEDGFASTPYQDKDW